MPASVNRLGNSENTSAPSRTAQMIWLYWVGATQAAGAFLAPRTISTLPRPPVKPMTMYFARTIGSGMNDMPKASMMMTFRHHCVSHAIGNDGDALFGLRYVAQKDGDARPEEGDEQGGQMPDAELAKPGTDDEEHAEETEGEAEPAAPCHVLLEHDNC